jgi:HAD superfamily hydrolase (TIGR01490 family)
MTLAIFDLDNTLLAGDSDYLWGRFLVEQGIVDETQYEQENQRFYDEYKQGTLDIYEFLRFSLQPLAQHNTTQLYIWRQQFIEEKIQPIILDAGRTLIEHHRAQGHALLIITATNRFVTEPIAEALGITELLATEPEFIDNRYTGNVSDIPCFKEGKVERLDAWLQQHQMDLQQSWFYSDSHNDLPLLNKVTHPYAVDPDPTLEDHARRQGWPIISLRETA